MDRDIDFIVNSGRIIYGDFAIDLLKETYTYLPKGEECMFSKEFKELIVKFIERREITKLYTLLDGARSQIKLRDSSESIEKIILGNAPTVDHTITFKGDKCYIDGEEVGCDKAIMLRNVLKICLK